MLLTAMPQELLLRVFTLLEDVRDKCQLSATCSLFHRLLRSHPWCWSPLNLSPHGDRISILVLFSILRNRSIPISLPQNSQNVARTRTIDRVNLSGCWCLSPEGLVVLASTVPLMTELFLDKFPAESGDMPLEQREHLYLTRPAHNLSSLSIDLSKESMRSMIVPESTLQQLMKHTQYLETLSLQHQTLGVDTCREFHHLAHLKHLNISSCTISQPALQILFHRTGALLESLIMLNIDLTSLTLLCLQQSCTSIRCLHLSCSEAQMVPGIARVVSHLPIEDFRLTRARGNIDAVVHALKPDMLKRLDISPRMALYPKFPRSFPRLLQTQGDSITTSHGSRDRPPLQRHKMTAAPSSVLATPYGKSNVSSGAKHGTFRPLSSIGIAVDRANSHSTSYLCRDEYDLCVSDNSLDRLATFSCLIELRLCFPNGLTVPSLTAFFQSSPHLKIFELRYMVSHEYLWKTGTTTKLDLMEGLRPQYTRQLQELYLFSVWLSESTADAIADMKRLRHITICDGGNIGGREPLFLRCWMTSLPNLQTIRFGKMHLHMDTIHDIVEREEDTAQNHSRLRFTNTPPSRECLARNSAEGEYHFHKQLGNWRWTTR